MIDSIPGVPEVIFAFLGRETIYENGDGLPQLIDGPCGGLSQVRFELGEGLLDRIEIGRVGRQVEQVGAGRLYGFTNTGDFVAGQVVHDDDIAGLEAGGKNLLGIGLEGGAVHGPVQHHGGTQAAQAQAGDEGGCLPMSPRRRGAQALATPGAAAQPGHVRFGAGFVYEDKPFRVEPSLPPAPELTLLRDVGAILFRRPLGFFYSCNQAREASC